MFPGNVVHTSQRIGFHDVRLRKCDGSHVVLLRTHGRWVDSFARLGAQRGIERTRAAQFEMMQSGRGTATHVDTDQCRRGGNPLDQFRTIQFGRLAIADGEFHFLVAQERDGIIDGDGKSHIRGDLFAHLGEIHTDHFPSFIDQRPAAVAGIDPRIDLKDLAIILLIHARNRSSRRLDVVAQNAGKRKSDGPHFFAELDLVRVGQ